MNDLQSQKLVVTRGDGTDEEEGSVSSIDDLSVFGEGPLRAIVSISLHAPNIRHTFILQKVTHSCPTCQNQLSHILDNLSLSFWW